MRKRYRNNGSRKAVEEIKAGKVEYRVDGLNIPVVVGKASFDAEKLRKILGQFANTCPLKPSTIKAFTSKTLPYHNHGSRNQNCSGINCISGTIIPLQ